LFPAPQSPLLAGLLRSDTERAILVEAADIVAPTPRVRDRAGRVLGAHPLRAADALQLAAALVWCDDAPQGETFVCLDDRLRQAAAREGFTLSPE
jgi:hypothetical protein